MELKSLTEQKLLLATLPPGKRARLHRLLFEFGPGNGTLMLLPIDQGIEHGPRDFFPNPASKDPDYQFRLAAEAGYSALACQIGMAEKYYPDYAGRVPLILKVNGKTDLPSSSKAFSSCNASVEDGVRLGADAIGYTLYVGRRARTRTRPAAPRPRGMRPLRDAARHLVLPARRSGRGQGRPELLLRDRLRGADGDGDGRRHRQAEHAEDDPGKDKDAPAPYNEMEVDQTEAIRQCVESAAARWSSSPAAPRPTTRPSSPTQGPQPEHEHRDHDLLGEAERFEERKAGILMSRARLAAGGAYSSTAPSLMRPAG